MRRAHFYCLLLAAAAVVSVPLSAEVYTLTLDNGATFETRYQPIEDPTDPDQLQLLTETGNWITLPVDIVVSVSASTEAQGFGRVIAANTIEIGMSLNDLAVPDVEGGPADSAQALLQYFRAQDQQRQDFTVQQFVEPEQAGVGGIPVVWATQPR